MLVLEGFAEPHNWIPYVQAGRIIDLYIVSLLERESLDFRSGLRIWSLELTVLRFSLMCGLQVKRLSRVSPRYLTSFALGIVILFNVTGGESRLRSEKVT